jgi:transcriptional regulator with XRE-family HTH domain
MGRSINPDGPVAALRAAIGRRLREARQKLGLTQTQLGDRLEVTQLSVSAYESGTTSLRADQLHRLHELGMDIESLVTGVPSIAHAGARREFAAAVAWVRQEFLAAGMAPPEEAVIDAAWMVYQRIHQTEERGSPEIREMRAAAKQAVADLLR